MSADILARDDASGLIVAPLQGHELKRTRLATLSAAVVLGLGGLLSAAQANPAQPPEHSHRRHIVVLKESSGEPRQVAAEHARRYDAEIVHVYEHALKGYAASFRGSGAGDAARDSRVAYVEPDREVKAFITQSNATWGLDRVDQRALPLSRSFTYTNSGSGVTAYIIDTGIRFGHAEFGGRAVSGYDAIDGGPADDCNGHGTHVAGTTGGTTYGVAKGVSLVAVRVLDCR
ncbi:MAG: S8 family serine peptidase, partial [Actinomycetota bacterium]|nr:S8 family serine peptidase [Actinomycetota bacterium]